MAKGTLLKTSLCLSAMFVSLGISQNVNAATIGSDVGIAGITPLMDNYYSSNQEQGTAEEYLIEVLQQLDKENGTNLTQIVAPYANLGISLADNYVNIRMEPNTESEVAGKLYNGCATDILETEGDWVKIKSGNVEGYIKSEFLAIGSDAEELIDEVSRKYAVIKTETLYVREEQSTESDILTMVPLDEKYHIKNEYEEWAEIVVDDITGFVSKEYIEIDVEFDYAISIEEEQAKIAAEEAARRAEEERLAQLARDEEARQEAARRQEEAARRQTSQGTQATTKPSQTQGSTQAPKQTEAPKKTEAPKQPASSTGSATGQAIASYGLNFVGNPYVWGGTSLTNGADCSGFTQSIYKHFGYTIPRDSRSQASGAGYEVSISNRQPGDLIFYTSGGSVNHVALYIGNNQVVHASNKKDGIKTSTYNYRTPYKIRRVVK